MTIKPRNINEKKSDSKYDSAHSMSPWAQLRIKRFCSFPFPHHIYGGVSSHRQSRFEPATRLLATFVRSHHSLRSLAPQRSAPFTSSLTHFAHSFVGWLKFLNISSRCNRVQRGETRFWSSVKTHPFSFVAHTFLARVPIEEGVKKAIL